VAQSCLAALSLGLLCASYGNLRADLQPSAGHLPDLANRASLENLPQVSASVLRTQIQQEQDPGKRGLLNLRLVELLMDGGRYKEALEVIGTPGQGADPRFTYWKGTALLGAGDYAGASDLFSSLLRTQTPVTGVSGDQIKLSLARSLRGKGDPAAAFALLADIPGDSPFSDEVLLERESDLLALGRIEECMKLFKTQPSSPEGKASAAYLKALALWRSGDAAAASKLFAAVPPVSPWYNSASVLGRALCLSSAGRNSDAMELLEKHLDEAADAMLLAEKFRLLDRLFAITATADPALLRKWSDDVSKPERARFARFYLGKEELRRGNFDKADVLLGKFLQGDPNDPLADEGRVLAALSKLRQEKPAEALAWCADRPGSPSKTRARICYIRGLASASLGHSEDALKAFQEAADQDPELSKNALFNKSVVIASKDSGKLDVSEAARGLIAGNDESASGEMEFQVALDLVRRGAPEGLALLSKISENSGDPSLKSRARLAAAEADMKSGKGMTADSELTKAIRENSGEPEREEYLEVFLRDSGRKSDAASVIASARAFLKAHPDSRFVPEIRLKLAESLLVSGDAQGARVEFEQLASSASGTELGRRSLFLAAQSAARAMDPSSIDDSIMLLDRVAQGGTNDQMAWRARFQQGVLKNAQNLPSEALAIYDKILTSEGPDAELRAATLMAKGDTQHFVGSKDQTQDQEALKTWQRIASDSSLPLRWRNQALCKSGMLLENMPGGGADSALAAYYEAFKNPRTNEPEQLWHDKAAFEAARLLESRSQWNDAVALFTQVMQEGGPRAEEARARIAKLRLENFLWEN